MDEVPVYIVYYPGLPEPGNVVMLPHWEEEDVARFAQVAKLEIVMLVDLRLFTSYTHSKVRTDKGQPYYITDVPDEFGIYHGTHKHTDTAAQLRWDVEGQKWYTIWEAEFDIRDYL